MTTTISASEQVARNATALAPLLRKHAAWTEENRRLHDEVVEGLADAGVFKLRQPRQYGGFEADTRATVEIGSILGQADASTSWVSSVYWIPGWMTCQFPDQVQDEIYSTPDVRVCGTLSPGGLATPVEGGVLVSGKWGFISGAHHAHWQEIIAIFTPPEGEPYPIMAVVPMSDLQVVDDWNTFGLRGTGSITTVAQELFIPQERVLPMPALLNGQGASKKNAGTAIYRGPLLPVACASSVGTLVGMAKGAQEIFHSRLSNRKITYTGYESQREAPLTHFQVAEATTKIDEAEFHALRLATLVDNKCEDAAEWKLEERAQCRADVGKVVRLAKEAIEIFAQASGGSSIYLDVPIQRVNRDVQAVNLHALMHPNTNAELYGRVLCGLEPNTLYI